MGNLFGNAKEEIEEGAHKAASLGKSAVGSVKSGVGSAYSSTKGFVNKTAAQAGGRRKRGGRRKSKKHKRSHRHRRSHKHRRTHKRGGRRRRRR